MARLPIKCPLSGYLPFLVEQVDRGGASLSSPIMIIVSDENQAAQLCEQAAFFLPQCPVSYLPAFDVGPFEGLSPSTSVMAMRARVLARLGEKEPCLWVVSAQTLIQKIPPPAYWNNHRFWLRSGEVFPYEQVIETLAFIGYERVESVFGYGEFAVRGNILDIYSPACDAPVRIEFVGDQVERITHFNPLDQRRAHEIQAIEVIPEREFLSNPETAKIFLENCRHVFADEGLYRHLFEKLQAGRNWPGMERLLPLFFAEPLTTVMAVAEPHMVLVEEGLDSLIVPLANALEKGAGSQPPRQIQPELNLLAPLARRFVLCADELGWQPKQVIQLTAFGTVSASEAENGRFQSLKPLIQEGERAQSRFDLFASRLRMHKSKGQRILLTCASPPSRERLCHLLAGLDMVHRVDIDSWAKAREMSPQCIAVTLAPLGHGFEMPEIVVYTEQDIFGAKLQRSAKRKRSADSVFRELAALGEGEYVVHRDHGIGRYEGLHLIESGGAAHDCLKLIYADDDRLYLPVENIDAISRYGAVEGHLALDKLGSAHWQSRQARVKKKIHDIATKLIQIAAERQLKPGEICEAPQGAFDEFCAQFPYAETDDQLNAIADIAADLTKGTPMDRLICGDVGFGKTEVALRAAFVVAATGRQVAVIVPTTLLCRQHEANFRQRFEPFGLKVASLSRLKKRAEVVETLHALKDGGVSVIIATHAVFSKQVAFSNLGLIIIDEEHHFGVGQKEKLKQSHPNVHVLSMTATPIPRTLHMALSGVREMSLIATPPVDRLAVKTYLTSFDATLLRDAIMRELSRKGQVFYISPRLEDLEHLHEMLKNLVPEARVGVAHGQMAAKELEEIMSGFYHAQFHILLATSIVESGIDMPSANTIIIHRADLFGMAQLYQLRGRVGRGQTQGYAYMLLPQDMKPKAMRRLSVLESLDTLGAGFTLASHDMDIRGVGNLVGSEQSGHIREVGVELYQALLNEAIQKQLAHRGPRTGLEEVTFSPQLNLGAPIFIPEGYVADRGVRLTLYRRAGALKTEAEVLEFAAELQDRFGHIPVEADNFLSTLKVKAFSLLAGIEKIDVGHKGVVLTFHGNRFANPAGLIELLQKGQGVLRLRPDHKLAYMKTWPTVEARMQGILSLCRQLGRVAQAGVSRGGGGIPPVEVGESES